MTGVWGYIGPGTGMPSQTSSPPITCGVYGFCGEGSAIGSSRDSGYGVIEQGATNGVHGISSPGNGVNGAGSQAKPAYGCRAFGESDNGYGVYGASGTGSAVYGASSAPHLAGKLAGNVLVSGTNDVHRITSNGTSR